MQATETNQNTRPLALSQRLESLDAFRGLVILTMTFVNYLARVDGIPPWARHMKEGVDGFTFVDVVFPGFLFIVGVAIPFALHKRMSSGKSTFELIGKIFARSASLIFVGVITVNKGNSFSETATGMKQSLWFFLAMISIIVLWNNYPPDASPKKKRLYLTLRILAGLVLVYLLAIFRANAGVQIVWLQTAWWGIVGMIGWAYLICSLAYLLVRGSSTALMGVLGLMIALYIGDHHGALNWLGSVHNLIGVGNVFGSTAADVMIGILVGNCFVGRAAGVSSAERVRFIFFFGVSLFAAGLLLRPLHGIEKVAATESYALVTGGICCVAFLIVYVLMDILQQKKWAKPLIPVGQNALLAYILPGILGNLCAVLGSKNFLYPYGNDWPGAINSAVLTILVLALTSGLTKRGVLLKL